MQLVLSDFFARKKLYLTLVSVFVLSVFILTIPMSIYSTISDKSFVNYLGIGIYDIRIDISDTAKNEEKLQALLNDLEKDPHVDKFEIYTGKLVDYKTDEGERQKLWIDAGKQESFPIKYISGAAPLDDNEISLSKLSSDELSKKENAILSIADNFCGKTLAWVNFSEPYAKNTVLASNKPSGTTVIAAVVIVLTIFTNSTLLKLYTV